MAISINDRQLITQFITNTQNLNVNLPTNGGGCANLVRGIIEQATGKRISVNPFGASLESMIQKINTYHDWLCKLNCVMLYSHSISSVGERPAPRGGTTCPD